METWKQEHAEDWLRELDRQGLGERVLIDTCNRWDLVINLNGISPDKLEQAAERQQLAYIHHGEAAYAQLVRVTAALDSLSPGESQITAQVRRAYTEASDADQLGKQLHFAFQSALRAAKRLRTELDLTTGETSLFSLAKPALMDTLGKGDAVAILGAGEMGSAVAHNLERDQLEQLLIVNRSLGSANELANATGGSPLKLDEFLANPPRLAAIICTLGGGFTLETETLAAIPGLKLIIDLAAPGNVPTTAVPPGVRHIQLADLTEAGAEQRRKLEDKLARGEAIVAEETAAAKEEWTERQLAETIVRIRSHYRKRVAELLPAEQAESVASRLARPQIAGLRAIARRYGLEAAETFVEGAGF